MLLAPRHQIVSQNVPEIGCQTLVLVLHRILQLKGKAFYGIVSEEMASKLDDNGYRTQIATDSALAIDATIQGLIKVDWQQNVDIPKRMIHLIGDYLIDEVRDKYQLTMSFEEIDKIAERCVEVAKLRYKQ